MKIYCIKISDYQFFILTYCIIKLETHELQKPLTFRYDNVCHNSLMHIKSKKKIGFIQNAS